MAAQLYRHYDADGRLLYVGRSLRSMFALRRQAQHERDCSWWTQVVRIEITHYGDTASADAAATAAEIEAIKTERPLYNKQHAPEKPVYVPVSAAASAARLRRRLKKGVHRGGEGPGIEARVENAVALLRGKEEST